MTGARSPDRAAADEAFMALALRLARRGLGAVWPNPAVGCVLTRDARVVGRGWTLPGGRPHAETEALRRAGEQAHGATAYVSLEPCAHHGVTPPCAEALITAGISRAVVALEDPDPRVAGRGLAMLRAAGIEVAIGPGAAAAKELNEGFFLRVGGGRPLVTLKLATSLDGRIATRTGDSRWITGEAARAAAHGLRAQADAVMVGIGTALADDPALDCRLPGLEERSPVRIVVDSRLRLPTSARMVVSAGRRPTWVATREGANSARRDALAAAGVEVIEVAADADGRVDLGALVTALGGRGLTRVLVEGGGTLAAGLIGAGLVDRVAWFHAPLLIGGDGRPAIGSLGVDRLREARLLRLHATEAFDGDRLGHYGPADR